MNQFYSSLIINFKKYPGVHQVFKPRYNKEFFKRLVKNIEQLKDHLDKRCVNSKTISSINYDLSKLKEESEQVIRARERLEKAIKSGVQDVDSIRAELGSIEERIMPFAIAIPNRHNKNIPNEEVILDQVSSDFAKKQNLTKTLSHTKLSYINNCYSKSVVGPNSHYYYGIGAKLQHGLADFFSSELENQNFVPVSGMSIVKTAVVEAANSRDVKDFATDPCRVLTNKPDCTTLHVVEASRESLVSFITTIGHMNTNNPFRMVTHGAAYRNCSDLFDSGDKNVSQFETVHALSVTPSAEKFSNVEYNQFRDIVWNIYKKLELPVRLIQCSLNGMISNEYDASRIEVWLPSRQQWIQVARVSHYLDYMTVRMGLKRGHIIDSMIMDGQALVAAIIENRQTSTGKFIIPSAIRSYIYQLTGDELNSYFATNQVDQIGVGKKASTSNDSNGSNVGGTNVLHNYEQRRYLVKKNYVFGHSHKSWKESTHIRKRIIIISLGGMIAFGTTIDWTELFRMYFPGPNDDPNEDYHERRIKDLSNYYPRLKLRGQKSRGSEEKESQDINTDRSNSSDK